AEAEERQKNRPSGDDERRLRRRLSELDKKLERARENFLAATPEVASGLLKTLETWEAERKQLLAEVEASARAEAGETLLAQISARLGDSAVCVESPSPLWEVDGRQVILIPAPRPPWTAVNLPQAAVLASEFREMLKRLGVRVSVWFRRKAKGKGKGYEVAK